jgi:hypothetical protein
VLNNVAAPSILLDLQNNLMNRCLFVAFLCCLTSAQAELTITTSQGVLLNAGDSFIFEFTSLDYIGPSGPGDSSLFFARFTAGTFGGDDSVLIELFPDSLAEVPLVFTFFGEEAPRRTNLIYRATVFGPSAPFWEDLQGIVRVTMLTGEAEFDGIGIHQLVDSGVYRHFFPIFPDADADGVPDYLDSCPQTPVGAVVNASGCSIYELVSCDRPWKSHGDYLNTLRSVTGDFVNESLISHADRRAIIIQGAKSNCGERSR